MSSPEHDSPETLMLKSKHDAQLTPRSITYLKEHMRTEKQQCGAQLNPLSQDLFFDDDESDGSMFIASSDCSTQAFEGQMMNTVPKRTLDHPRLSPTLFDLDLKKRKKPMPTATTTIVELPTVATSNPSTSSPKMTQYQREKLRILKEESDSKKEFRDNYLKLFKELIDKL